MDTKASRRAAQKQYICANGHSQSFLYRELDAPKSTKPTTAGLSTLMTNPRTHTPHSFISSDSSSTSYSSETDSNATFYSQEANLSVAVRRYEHSFTPPLTMALDEVDDDTLEKVPLNSADVLSASVRCAESILFLADIY